jgi:hypothetical protein
MAVIPIETMVPSSGAVPSNGYDPDSLAGFTEWDLGDEARFSIVVPENYVVGNNFSLRLEESSPTAAAAHGWQVTTLLLRPGSSVTDEQVLAETTGVDYLSPSVAQQLATRTFPVTGGSGAGRVGDVLVQAGDVLSFILRRVPVETLDDPEAINLFDVSVVIRADETVASDCAGRVGTIVDSVRDLFNEAAGGFLSDLFILRSLNRCLQDLAQENYWRGETWLPALSGTGEVDLLQEIPNYQDVHQVRFSGRDSPMVPLNSFPEYQDLKAASSGRGAPEYYVVQNNKIYVWPIPSQSTASGYCVYHSFLPEEITCSPDNPNPDIPRAHDMIFVYFALKQAFLRDRHAPGADTKFTEYSQLYQRAKQSLLGEGEPPRLSLKPSR